MIEGLRTVFLIANGVSMKAHAIMECTKSETSMFLVKSCFQYKVVLLSSCFLFLFGEKREFLLLFLHIYTWWHLEKSERKLSAVLLRLFFSHSYFSSSIFQIFKLSSLLNIVIIEKKILGKYSVTVLFQYFFFY